MLMLASVRSWMGGGGLWAAAGVTRSGLRHSILVSVNQSSRAIITRRGAHVGMVGMIILLIWLMQLCGIRGRALRGFYRSNGQGQLPVAWCCYYWFFPFPLLGGWLSSRDM